MFFKDRRGKFYREEIDEEKNILNSRVWRLKIEDLFDDHELILNED